LKLFFIFILSKSAIYESKQSQGQGGWQSITNSDMATNHER